MHTSQLSTRRLLARAAGLTLAWAWPPPPAPRPSRQACARRDRRAANPTKTVVLDLAVLDTLHALGVDVTGVPPPPSCRRSWNSTRTSAT